METQLNIRLVLRSKSLNGREIKNLASCSCYDTFGSYIKVIQNILQPNYLFIFSQTFPLISMNNGKLIGDFNDWCICMFNDKQVLNWNVFQISVLINLK